MRRVADRAAPALRAARRAGPILLLIGALYFWVGYQVTAAQHRWCATLELITARPVPRPADPSANPSRATAYRFYADFRELRREFGCG